MAIADASVKQKLVLPSGREINSIEELLEHVETSDSSAYQTDINGNMKDILLWISDLNPRLSGLLNQARTRTETIAALRYGVKRVNESQTAEFNLRLKASRSIELRRAPAPDMQSTASDIKEDTIEQDVEVLVDEQDFMSREFAQGLLFGLLLGMLIFTMIRVTA